MISYDITWYTIRDKQRDKQEMAKGVKYQIYNVLCCVVLCCVVLCCVVLCCVVLRCVVCCVVLCCVVLCCGVILYYIILCYIIILYYIMCEAAPSWPPAARSSPLAARS